MKFTIILLTLMVLGAAHAKLHPIKTFEEFKQFFNKHYESTEEEEIRRQNFLESLNYVETHEGVEINQFSDLTLDEFRSFYMMDMDSYKQNKSYFDYGFCSISNKSLPSSIDLRKLKTITPIRNQGNCASCWAFVSVACIESAYLTFRNQNLNLSVQELIDCGSPHGCHADAISNGMEYLIAHGVVSERAHPYNARENKCRYYDSKRYFISGYCLIHPPSENTIKQILSQAHMAVAAEIEIHDLNAFRHYDGRTYIRYNDGNDRAYHAVNIVGYGTDLGVDYWIIRNSWGTKWGDYGYAYIQQHKNLMKIDENVFAVIL